MGSMQQTMEGMRCAMEALSSRMADVEKRQDKPGE